MQEAVFKVEVHDHKEKQKVLKTISGLAGVDSFSIDMKDKKLKVVGDIDPVSIVSKLKKLCHAEVVFVGPATAKEPQHKYGEGKKKDDDERKINYNLYNMFGEEENPSSYREGKKKPQQKDGEGKKKDDDEIKINNNLYNVLGAEENPSSYCVIC